MSQRFHARIKRSEALIYLERPPAGAVYYGIMNEHLSNIPDRVAFIADAHLGLPDDDPARHENLVSFIRMMRGHISHLYIVGDLFDFWFEYTSVVPNTAPRVVFELYNLVVSGTKVTLFGGNHDHWLGPYLSDDVGLHIVRDGLTVEHQGLRLYMHHGDGLYPDDHGYRILKQILRSPVSIFLFRLLHPDLARHIARISSKTSRTYLAPPGRTDRYREVFREIADKKLSEGFDAVVYGHSHIELLEKRNVGHLILLGDWLTRNTYILLENGEFSLHNWHASSEVSDG